MFADILTRWPLDAVTIASQCKQGGLSTMSTQSTRMEDTSMMAMVLSRVRIMTARMRVFSAMTRNHLEMTLKALTFSQVTSATRILRLTTRSACRSTADKAISPDASGHSAQQDESSLQADLQSYVAQKGCSRGSGKLYRILAAEENQTSCNPPN